MQPSLTVVLLERDFCHRESFVCREGGLSCIPPEVGLEGTIGGSVAPPKQLPLGHLSLLRRLALAVTLVLGRGQIFLGGGGCQGCERTGIMGESSGQ